MAKEAPERKVIKRICAWCNKVMQDGMEPATHGICQPCSKRVMDSYERSTFRASSIRGASKVLPGTPL